MKTRGNSLSDTEESEINTPDIATATENDADLIEYEGVDES